MNLDNKKFRYKNLLLYSSLQFHGNMEEYFAKNTEKLIVYIVLPRVQNTPNLLRVYKKGVLVTENKVWSSTNFFFYFASWYFHYLLYFFKYFSKNEKFFVFTAHPVSFFGSTFQRFFRKVEFIFFIGDYFPTKEPIIRINEWVKKYYHDRITYTCYLSDTINKIMNGKVLITDNRKTIMWGVKPKIVRKKIPAGNFTFLFVGVIKESQGLEFFYKFMKINKNYFLKIIGVCEKELFLKHQRLIKLYKIQDQVYFPNKFFTDKELQEISGICHVGIALYETGTLNVTYYTDPGKIKAYTELGLPVIMSNTSAIVPFVKKFKAGEIVEKNEVSINNAIKKIKDNYNIYMEGIKKFNKYFFFETYYPSKFKFLEF